MSLGVYVNIRQVARKQAREGWGSPSQGFELEHKLGFFREDTQRPPVHANTRLVGERHLLRRFGMARLQANTPNVICTLEARGAAVLIRLSAEHPLGLVDGPLEVLRSVADCVWLAIDRDVVSLNAVARADTTLGNVHAVARHLQLAVLEHRTRRRIATRVREDKAAKRRGGGGTPAPATAPPPP